MAYSVELKKQALNLVKAGVSITDICKDLKIKNRATRNNFVQHTLYEVIRFGFDMVYYFIYFFSDSLAATFEIVFNTCA